MNAFWRSNIGATIRRTRARSRARQPAPAAGLSARGSDSAWRAATCRSSYGGGGCGRSRSCCRALASAVSASLYARSAALRSAYRRLRSSGEIVRLVMGRTACGRSPAIVVAGPLVAHPGRCQPGGQRTMISLRSGGCRGRAGGGARNPSCRDRRTCRGRRLPRPARGSPAPPPVRHRPSRARGASASAAGPSA